jgi:hypothetical protein
LISRRVSTPRYSDAGKGIGSLSGAVSRQTGKRLKFWALRKMEERKEDENPRWVREINEFLEAIKKN